MMETGEIFFETVHASPRLPPKISFKDNWMKELGSEVAGGGKNSQQTQPKPKIQGRPVLAEQPSGSSAQEIEKVVLFDYESTNVRKGGPVKSCVPVSVECLDQDKDADENVDADQVSTGRPVESEQSIGLFTQREEIDIDFRVSELPHAVVKKAENFRGRELIKKTESHLHRETLQADWQQNNSNNPFSEESKVMIREMDNVELLELCDKIQKVQCSECLLHWNQGVIYCTCGHLLKESESSQDFHQWRSKTEAQQEHFAAHNTRRRCLKKNFEGIHDRFQRAPVYRDSQLKIGWTKEKCIETDNLAKENDSYCPSSEEYERYEKLVYLTEQIRQKCTDETPIRLPRSTDKYAPSPPRIWRRAT